MSEPARPPAPGTRRWIVRVDTARCGLCEVCVRHCPTGALSSERVAGVLRTYFSAELCTDCAAGETCEDVCTERALQRVVDESAEPGPERTLLNESEMARCSYCGEYFAPQRRLEAVSRRRESGRGVVQEYCPLCRRTQLVVRFIDEKRPDAKAEYRATHDILRRAVHEEEK